MGPRSLALLRAFAAAGGAASCCSGPAPSTTGARRTARCASATRPSARRRSYGRSKDELRSAAEALSAAAGFEFAWARLFFMYGPDEPPARIVAAVIRSLLAGEPVKTTSGSQRRDFIARRGRRARARRPARQRRVRAGERRSGQAPSIAEVIDAIAATVGADGLANAARSRTARASRRCSSLT